MDRVIGHYRLLRELGAGGMGIVYEAEDLKLGRRVALKFVKDHTSAAPETIARFQREARAASALNHPHICTIYDIETFEGNEFIAMELLQGESLQERLTRGPLPTREVVRLGLQIADALAAAHKAGIVHRDIKPGNIFIGEQDRAKILDFGLAKTEVHRHAGMATTQVAATVTTDSSSFSGTLSYMSPEQARGEALDGRSDLFSLGALLYEAATGSPAFAGKTAAVIIDSLLNKTPESASAINPAIPAELDNILKKLLEKDRDRRYQSAVEVRDEFSKLLRAMDAQSAEMRGTRKRLPLIAALAVLALILAGISLLQTRRASDPRQHRPQPKLIQVTTDTGLHEFPNWSPDAQKIAFSKEINGFNQIFVKGLVGGEEKQLTSGDYDHLQPRWSPDGKYVLYVRATSPGGKIEPGDIFGEYSDGDIWRKELASGGESKLIANAFNPAFSPDGKSIAVDASWAGPRRIWVVNENGANPQQITTDTSEAVAHVVPSWSADGKRIAFQNIERTKFDIKVADVNSRESWSLTDDIYQDLNPVWSHTGRTVYFSSYRSGGLNIWRIPVNESGRSAGPPEQVTVGAGQDVQLAMDRDGKKIAFSMLRQNADIWRLPVSPETGLPTGTPEEVLASTREDSRAAPSPSSSQIAFNSDRGGQMNIWLRRKDGTLKQVTSGGDGDFQPNWSPDEKRLVFFSARSGNPDIWSVDLATLKLAQLTNTPTIEINPFFSPDGKRIAFQSDRSGRMEVWVMNADGSGQRQVTKLGVTGHYMRWSRDGSSLIFRCACGNQPRTYEVAINGGDPIPWPDIQGGSHMSLSPDSNLVMDVVGHKVLWVSSVKTGESKKVFEFPDVESRIDYPVWTPDGKWVIFDRFKPQGGDIWAMENFE